MWFELSYVLFASLLAAYSFWRYARAREKSRLYLAASSAFLTFSAIFQMLNSEIWINIITSRLLEIGGLASFAGFTVTAIIAMKGIFKEN